MRETEEKQERMAVQDDPGLALRNRSIAAYKNLVKLTPQQEQRIKARVENLISRDNLHAAPITDVINVITGILTEEIENKLKNKKWNYALFGQTAAGKSSLLNSLLGRKVQETATKLDKNNTTTESKFYDLSGDVRIVDHAGWGTTTFQSDDYMQNNCDYLANESIDLGILVLARGEISIESDFKMYKALTTRANSEDEIDINVPFIVVGTRFDKLLKNTRDQDHLAEVINRYEAKIHDPQIGLGLPENEHIRFVANLDGDAPIGASITPGEGINELRGELLNQVKEKVIQTTRENTLAYYTKVYLPMFINTYLDKRKDYLKEEFTSTLRQEYIEQEKKIVSGCITENGLKDLKGKVYSGFGFEVDSKDINVYPDLERPTLIGSWGMFFWGAKFVLTLSGSYFNSFIPTKESLAKDELERVFNDQIKCEKQLAAEVMKSAIREKLAGQADIGMNKHCANARLKIGTQKLAERDYDKAIREFSDALKFDDNLGQAYFQRAKCYHVKNEHQQCVNDCLRAIQNGVVDYRCHYMLGHSYMSQKKYADAVVALKDTVALDVNNYKAYNALGRSYYKIDDYRKANEAASRAVTINPNFAEAYNTIGLIYTARSGYDTAIVNFTKALAINPNYKEARDNRRDAVIYKKQEEDEKAREEAAKIAEQERQREEEEYKRTHLFPKSYDYASCD